MNEARRLIGQDLEISLTVWGGSANRDATSLVQMRLLGQDLEIRMAVWGGSANDSKSLLRQGLEMSWAV